MTVQVCQECLGSEEPGKPEAVQPALETPLAYTQPTVSTLPVVSQSLSPNRQPDGNDAPQTMGVENTSAIIRLTYAFGGQAVATRIINGSSTLYYIHNDHLGSNSRMSTSAGSAVANSTARYTPFGDWRTEPTANLTDRGYTGHLHNNLGSGSDDLGLIYMNARYYLPSSGRFISPDTIIPNPANPQSWNRYSYVENNPLRYTDPTGHCPAPTNENGYSGSGNIICVAWFIPTPWSEVPFSPDFQGDDREFSSDSNKDASRAWAWIDTDTGEIIDQNIHATCNSWGQCAGPLDDEGLYQNSINAELQENGDIIVNYNIRCAGVRCNLGAPGPNGEITFVKNDEGGFTSKGNINAFPNVEAYQYVQGSENNPVTLFRHQFFSKEELDIGIIAFSSSTSGMLGLNQHEWDYTHNTYMQSGR